MTAKRPFCSRWSVTRIQIASVYLSEVLSVLCLHGASKQTFGLEISARFQVIQWHLSFVNNCQSRQNQK